MVEKKIELSNSAQGFFIRANRFKTTQISYNFYLSLNKDRVADFALLPFILTSCSKQYPDFSKLNFKLNKLYSAELFASAEKAGDYQMLKMGISVIDDRYALDGETLVLEAVKLLNCLVFEPLLENGAFAECDVNREKRKAIEHIQSEMSEKRVYAKQRMIEEMYKDDIFGIPKCGSIKQVEAVTPKTLFNAWEDMLKYAFIRVNVISGSMPGSVFEDIKSRLCEVDRTNAVKLSPSNLTKPAYAAKHIEEKMDVAQGKLVMGFSVGLGKDERENAPFTVMCDIFGGGPYSRLFTNVREKMGLCYYCSASIDKRKGLLSVESGVESENAKKAEAEITRQLEIVKSGKFTDFEFESSKKSIINSLKSYSDHQGAIDGWYSLKCLEDEPVSPEEYAEMISEVTKEEVCAAAKQVKLHTVYMLMPKGEK